MPSLRSPNLRFGTRFMILDGGSGQFKGILSEPNPGEVPSSVFTLPRRLLRVTPDLPIRIGMVVASEDGAVFMVAHHGEAQGRGGIQFQSFRLFEAEGRFSWIRRAKATDVVTGLEKEIAPITMPPIWGAYEPGTIEAFDRQIRSSFESGRFITNQHIQRDDIIDGRKVSRADHQLGLWILTLG